MIPGTFNGAKRVARSPSRVPYLRERRPPRTPAAANFIVKTFNRISSDEPVYFATANFIPSAL